jgi:osmoprotectant transport system permease protein
MAGIRTAAVWTIGAATLATTVGQPSLGNLIFAGLQTENWVLVLVGCLAAAALALAVDGLLGLVEQGRIVAGLAGIALILGFAMLPAFTPTKATVTIGAKNFSEQYILARLIGDRLEHAGYAVRYSEGLGSAVAFRALSGGDIDVYVDYSGTIWTNLMGRSDVPLRRAMIREIGRWMAAGPRTGLVGPLGFENAYALAMRRDTNIRSIADLARVAPGLALGADLEFLDRPEWATIRKAYDLHFRDSRAYSPTFMYRALTSGHADVISAFSSDGRIAAQSLVVLTDPKGAVPSYDALLLVSPQRRNDRRFLAALRPLVGSIPVEWMREANYMVDRDEAKASPEAAAHWLLTKTAAPSP